MSDNEPRAPRIEGDLWRWLLLAFLISLGIVLFFRYGPQAQPVIHGPVSQESD